MFLSERAELQKTTHCFSVIQQKLGLLLSAAGFETNPRLDLQGLMPISTVRWELPGLVGMMEPAEELTGPLRVVCCAVCSVFRLSCLANHITSVSSLWLETNCKQDVKVELF